MNLFGRQIRLEAGGKLIEPPLTIYFDVDFDDSEKINMTSIKIYNLSDKTISAFKTDTPVLLSAGYKGDTGLIFQGVIKKVSTDWEGVDKITELECADAHGSYLKGKVSRTFAPNTTAKTVLQYLIDQAGLGIGDLNPPVNFVYRKGKVVKGNVSDRLKEVAKDCKAKMHITRGKIYIRDTAKGDNRAFVVDKDSGLIEDPDIIEEETEDKKTGKKTKKVGYKVKMLLNHRITVDSVIVLKSRKVNGTFRVSKGSHTCNGNDFYTIVEVYR